MGPSWMTPSPSSRMIQSDLEFLGLFWDSLGPLCSVTQSHMSHGRGGMEEAWQTMMTVATAHTLIGSCVLQLAALLI